MKYDLMLIGPATRGTSISTIPVREVREIGGAVFLCIRCCSRFRKPFRFSQDPSGRYRCTGCISSGQRPYRHAARRMHHPHAEHLLHRRPRTPQGECLASRMPITPDQIPDVDCGLYHLAGLLYGDFPNELIVELKKAARYPRIFRASSVITRGGLMNFHDWSDKLEYLKYFDFLKTDAAEAEILTGLTDRREAAKQLYAWGAKGNPHLPQQRNAGL